MGIFGLHPLPFLIVAAILGIVAYRLHRRLGIADRTHRQEVEEYLSLAGAMLIVLDRDARIRTANRKACEVFGRDEAELTGADWFATVAGARDRAASKHKFDQIFAGNVQRGRSERSVARPDGTERLVEWEFATRVDATGRVVNVLASGQDITERRAAEVQLAGLRRLAQGVAANPDARQLVVDHAFELLGASSVSLLESGVVTTSRADGSGSSVDPVRTSVILNGESLATLEVHWSDAAHAAVPARDDLLAILAGEMATALGRLELLRTLEQKAVRDVLTGAPNRRALEDELPRMLARAARSREPLSVVAMDLNAFKALNDADGHDAGDRALKACAAAWTTELRVTDMLVRLGGDEFVALLPDCPRDRAVEVADRLRRATPHRGGSSIGVVTHREGEGEDELLQRADQALYADKARCRAGRLSDPARVAAVKLTGLTHGDGDPELDDITCTAQWLLDVPTAMVNLLDADRLTFASHCGLSAELAADGGAVASESFCQLAVVTGDPLVIDDTRRDVRVAGHPAIADGVLTYAGVPLIDEAGNVLGVLCVMGDEPRAWSATEVGTLTTLAERASARLAARAVVA